MKIAVIGAGASGLLAALNADWQGASVTLFERNDSLGRKLLVTGSGRCNLTNDQVATNPYTCSDSDWLTTVLNRFGVSNLLYTLDKIGIPTYKTWDGWYYPRSNSAHSVVNAFNHAVEISEIKIRRTSQVIDISQIEKGFSVFFLHNNQKIKADFDKVIVATGGKAYPSLGSTGEMFPVLEKLGHRINPIKPALAPILADLNRLKLLQGIRLDLGTKLYQSEKALASAAGNMIFTKWGLNGPAVMDLSHHIPNPAGKHLQISLNLLHFIESEFTHLLDKKRHTEFPVNLLLSAFFPPKVVHTYTGLLGIPENTPLNALNEPTLRRLIKALKDTRLKVLGVRGYQYCQSSSGGVPVSEVSPISLESHLCKGLYLTGETLDVVGPCGGYNLHFAFASGSLAGRAAASNDSRDLT
jgi:predicted Rossmann fold flavoprotein